MKEPSVFDQLQKGVGDAISDVREKLEESLFGRAVTDKSQSLPWPEAKEHEQPGFGSSVTHYEKGMRWPEAKEAGVHEQTKELGIDR